MAKLNITNRNAGQLDKNGKPKSPNWQYRFQGAKVDGKRKWIQKSGFRTKKDAEIAGTQAMAEYNNAGLSFEPSEISVSDFLDYWLKNYCALNIADSTMTAYKNIIEKHLKPRIGFYKLKAVNTLILQEMINDLALHSGFTKNFMKNILKVLKGAFKYAKVTAKLIKDNPAEDVALPKMRQSAEAEEIIILTKDEVNKILERFKNSPATYYGILTAYYTGLRVSEVYGLTWDCIDLENKKITVEKIVKPIEVKTKIPTSTNKSKKKSASRWYLGEPKTKSSYRTIDIGDTLVNALKEYKSMQEKFKEEYGEYYHRHFLKDEISEANREVQRIISVQYTDFEVPLKEANLVFVKDNGEFRGSDTAKYPSKIINNELGIKYNFHALRHTHATMLIEAGVTVKAVSERLGHSNTRTTLETYVHVTENMRNDAVTKFETIGDLNKNATIVNFSDIKRKVDSVAK